MSRRRFGILLMCLAAMTQLLSGCGGDAEKTSSGGRTGGIAVKDEPSGDEAPGSPTVTTDEGEFDADAAIGSLPTVLLAKPWGGKRVPLDVVVEITFSEPMDEATFEKGIGFVNISKSAYNHISDPFVAALKSGNTYTFKPVGGVWGEATYTFIIGTGVKNKAGVKLAKSYQSSFQTSSHEASSTGTPAAVKVVWTSPSDGESYQSVSSSISVGFNEKMDADTVQSKFKIYKGSSAVPGSVNPVGEKIFYFNPTANLLKDTYYTILIERGVKSKAGGTLATDYQASFKTAK